MPRYSFTGNGKSDSVTTAWMIWSRIPLAGPAHVSCYDADRPYADSWQRGRPGFGAGRQFSRTARLSPALKEVRQQRKTRLLEKIEKHGDKEWTAHAWSATGRFQPVPRCVWHCAILPYGLRVDPFCRCLCGGAASAPHLPAAAASTQAQFPVHWETGDWSLLSR
jgi:hypothetical protein